MALSIQELLELAATAPEESDLIDFKREFSPQKKAAFWAETVKDIVAMANTRGGALVFGIEDDGSPSKEDYNALFGFDSAQLCDQVKKYTGSDISGLTIADVSRDGVNYPAILVEAVSIPLVFTKVGTYEIEPGKQKTAFSVGTVYFRHGSKSEPCTRNDLELSIEKRLSQLRDEWLGNIRKVVEAPLGASVIVTNTTAQSEVRITNNPDAPTVKIQTLSDSFPYRQSDVIRIVNERLVGIAKINTHDIQAIKSREEIDHDATPQFVHKPHAKSSPQYSPAFIEHVIAKHDQDNEFFRKCRAHWKEANYS